MSARIAAVLVVLLLALGGGALLLQRQETDRRPSNSGALGQRLMKDLKAADIASIRIVEPKATLTLQRKDEGWVIAERDGFPADLAKVREFVVKAIELKVGQSEPITEKDRARLNLDQSGTQVEFNGPDGKPLAKLIAGKKYFRREVDNAEKAAGDGRFVMRPEEPGVVYVVSDPLAQATTRTASWIDRTAFKVEKVGMLQVKTPDGNGYRIERAKDDAEWKLADARPGEALEVTKANAASYVLGTLELADVAPKDAKDTGLDNPTVIEATTLAGVSYVIKVGKPAGDNLHVSFTSTGADPREKLLSQHVLLIPKAKLEDTLKPRAEMLAKKDDAKK